MKNLILSAAALALTAGIALAGSHSVVRMGTEGAYPPYNFINDKGEVDGFERELGNVTAWSGLGSTPGAAPADGQSPTPPRGGSHVPI